MQRQLLRLAPLREGQAREDSMLVTSAARIREVHGMTVQGRIGSRGDRFDDTASELTMVEDSVWRENPLHRGSANLVELDFSMIRLLLMRPHGAGDRKAYASRLPSDIP
jgi:hypothetical protein